MSLFGKLKDTLNRTRQKLGDSLKRVLLAHIRIDESLYIDLEEALISADVGVETTEALLSRLRERLKREPAGEGEVADHVRRLLAETIEELMSPVQVTKELNLSGSPTVILIVGVNGSGKTTTIAKLTKHLQQEGKKILLAGADTFRAAASEQLATWGQRLGVQVISQKSGADSAAVAFDALQAAKARGYDVLIVDTAGRLHNKANLMNELEKITRVLKKVEPSAPHEVLLVLDANTGQNMIQQTRVFQEISGVTGLVLAKLDGTAKGGAVISVCHETKLPVRYIGVGEKVDDLEIFDPHAFAQALFDLPEEAV